MSNANESMQTPPAVHPRPRLIMLEPSAKPKPKPKSKPLFLLESTPLPVAKTLTMPGTQKMLLPQTRSKDLVRVLELKEQEESGGKTMSLPRTPSIDDLVKDLELKEQDEGGRRRRLSFPNDGARSVEADDDDDDDNGSDDSDNGSDDSDTNNGSDDTDNGSSNKSSSRAGQQPRRAAERRHQDGTLAEKAHVLASKARRPREAARRKFQRKIRQEVKWVQPYYKSTATEAAASKLLFFVAVGLYLSRCVSMPFVLRFDPTDTEDRLEGNNKEDAFPDMTRLLVDQCIQTYRKWLLCGVCLSVVLFCYFF